MTKKRKTSASSKKKKVAKNGNSSVKSKNFVKLVKNIARGELEEHRCYNDFLNGASISQLPAAADYKIIKCSAVTSSAPLTRDEGVVLGATYHTRTGSKIFVKSLRILGTFLQNGGATSTVLRLLIWRQHIPGNIGASDLLATADSGYLSVYAPYNRDNAAKNFTMLYDKVYMLGTDRNQCKFDIKLRNLGEVTYVGPLSTDWNKGMICMMTMSDRAALLPVIYMASWAVIQDV